MIRLDKTRDKDKQIKSGGVASLCTLLMGPFKKRQAMQWASVIIVYHHKQCNNMMSIVYFVMHNMHIMQDYIIEGYLLCHAREEIVHNVRRRMIEPALTVSAETSEIVPAKADSVATVISSDIWVCM